MELQHLKAFVQVADHGSITRAAEALHSSQPAISAQLKALEGEFGVALFRRTARGMTLTGEGASLLPRARQALSEAAGLLRDARRLAGDALGTLRVGVIHCGFDLRIPAISERVVAAFPEIEIEIVSGNSGGLLRQLIDDRIDVAFVEGEFVDERLHDWRIGTSELVIIGPGKWRDDLSDAGWARLGEFPWVFQGPDCSYARLLDRLSAEHGVSFRKQYGAEQFGAMHGLVAQGLAMSIADIDEVRPMLDDGRVFAWGAFRYPMPVRLIAMKSRVDEPAMRAFAEATRGVHDGGRDRVRRRARPLQSAE
ncbi:MAG: LysR family transcriptional regulator [Planctomycetota bacterium]